MTLTVNPTFKDNTKITTKIIVFARKSNKNHWWTYNTLMIERWVDEKINNAYLSNFSNIIDYFE